MNTVKKGDALEKELFEDIQRQIDGSVYPYSKEYCRIYRQKAYYSRERGDNIIFDVVVEFLEPETGQISGITFFECKNYSGKISVGKLEEFSSKVMQVARLNSKAIFVTRSELQQGAKTFAENTGMGWIKYDDLGKSRRILPRGEQYLYTDIKTILKYLCPADAVYDYLPLRKTYYYDGVIYFSMRQFSQVMYGDFPSALPKYSQKIADTSIKFLSKEEMEALATKILKGSGHIDGPVSLMDLYKSVQSAGVSMCLKFSDNHVHYPSCLGSFDFLDNRITVFPDNHQTFEQMRFTVLHELAHYFMGHGKYIDEEIYIGEDFETIQYYAHQAEELRRAEFQANYLAACLLLPRTEFNKHLYRILQNIRLYDKGFGLIYSDGQRVNSRNRRWIVQLLSNKFKASKMAVEIRLKELGHLKEENEFVDTKEALSKLTLFNFGRDK